MNDCTAKVSRYKRMYLESLSISLLAKLNLVLKTTQRDILAVFCVFASGEDEYWRKYCDVVQGQYIA